MISILVVDDEQGMRDFLKIMLKKSGYQVHTANNGDMALSLIRERPFDLVISDIRMPGTSGLDLLGGIKEIAPDLPVIMITAFASPDDAVIAMKNGAFDYISKPFNIEEIKSVVESATSRKSRSGPQTQNTESFPGIIGQSREMLKIYDIIRRIAPTPASVLI